MTLLRRLATPLLAASLSLNALPSSASAPCPKPPCAPSVSESLNQCGMVADWIVEGQVVSVTQGTRIEGALGPYKAILDRDNSVIGVHREVVQVELWDGGQVVLTKIQVLKGLAPAAGRQMTVRGASHCWRAEARIPEGQVGRRVRVYGTDNELNSGVLSAQITPGIFAATALDELGRPVQFY